MSNVKTFFKDIKVVMARGIHLFPFRTEKLSLVTPMVLRNSGRVGSRRFRRGSQFERLTPFFCMRGTPYLSGLVHPFTGKEVKRAQ